MAKLYTRLARARSRLVKARARSLTIIVSSGPDLSRSKLGLVRLLIRTAKAKFGQVVYQVSQGKDRMVKARARSLTIIQKDIFW